MKTPLLIPVFLCLFLDVMFTHPRDDGNQGSLRPSVIVWSSIFVILVSSFILLFWEWIGEESDDDLHDASSSVSLVMTILSSRFNFDERQVIRDTWFNKTKFEEFKWSGFFVVGNDDCRVPPQDRISPFDCIERIFTQDDLTHVFSFRVINERRQEEEKKSCYSDTTGKRHDINVFSGVSFEVIGSSACNEKF